MDAPRILVLTTSFPSTEDDWAGIFIAKLLKALQRRGYGVTVLAPSDGVVYGRRTVHGVETIRFPYFLPRSLERLARGAGGIPENLKVSALARLQLPFMTACFLAQTLRWIRGRDLIYANWIGAGVVGAAASKITGKPLVVSYRGDDGYLARDRPVWRFFTRRVSNRASITAPVSAEIGRILIDLGIDAGKVRVPQFGVDTEMYHPAEGDRSPSETVEILFVGSLIPRKGLQDLIAALDDPWLRASVRLTVVGDGFYGPELRRMGERLGLNDLIEWKGILPPNKTAERMRQSDLLCLPSSMEGRPNVVNEAMASAIPVVAARIGGIPDMVIEGETALLYESGNVEELREHLKQLVGSADLRRRMGRAGLEFLRKSGVSWDATAAEFDEIFREVLGRRG